MSDSDPAQMQHVMNEWGLKSIEGSLFLGGLSSMYLLEVLFRSRIFLLEKTKDFLNLFYNTEKTPLINVDSNLVREKIQSHIPNTSLIVVRNGLTGMLVGKDHIFFLENMNMVLYELNLYEDTLEKKRVYRMNPFFYTLYDKSSSAHGKNMHLKNLSSDCLLHMILNDLLFYKQILFTGVSQALSSLLVDPTDFKKVIEKILKILESAMKKSRGGPLNISNITRLFGLYQSGQENPSMMHPTATTTSQFVLEKIVQDIQYSQFFLGMNHMYDTKPEHRNSIFYRGVQNGSQSENNIIPLQTLLGENFDLDIPLSAQFFIHCFNENDILNYEGNPDLKQLWKYKGKLGYKISREMLI